MNITSWILLEQAEDAPDWGFPDRSGGVLWISKNRQIEFAFPSGFEVQEPFICILSLPRTKTDSPKSLGVAIHMVVDALRKDNQKIRLWCHYGGNINPALAGTIWRHWPRLQTECKVKLTEVAADPGFPLPFSKGQKNLPCYSDFERLRKDIRSGISYAAAAHKLQGLWQRTREALNVEAQLQSIVKAGNFGISARRLLEIIGFGDQESSVSTALTALHFYQSFGFDSLIKPSFPSPIEDDDGQVSPYFLLRDAARNWSVEAGTLADTAFPKNSTAPLEIDIKIAFNAFRASLTLFVKQWRDHTSYLLRVIDPEAGTKLPPEETNPPAKPLPTEKDV